jgi:hypothetical protein
MTIRDLKKVIPEFDKFAKFISKFRDVVDTGKLAEFYCSKLFRLKLVKPRNSNIDATSPPGKKIEIKHRFYKREIPPGMKIDLRNIDYVLYVGLDDDLLPKRIYKIESKDINYTTHKRVSFRKAFKENKAKLVFQRQ